jgi:transcriptional regulator with PAS, ATPase and Fis domain
MFGGSEPCTRIRPARVRVRYSKVRVQVVRGPDAGGNVELAAQIVRVGTADDNDLVLSDDTISRHHCELEPVPGGIRVRDVGSTNGVFHGALRVYDAVVPLEGRVRLGQTEIELASLSETVEREQSTTEGFGDLLGSSPRMRELYADLERIAPTDVTLLIEGETGTGKELIAESVHRASPRADRPFVVCDCGAVSPTLAESELFGHERGAFTGAVQAHAGVFEQAQGGTLLLDEIGELPLDLQPKLLRALESRQVRRIGGSRVVPVDVRIVAATNRHLRSEVARGRFRQDLYFRLAAAQVAAPPLRERIEDLPVLVAHFLRVERPPRHIEDVPEHVWSLFRSYRWPGNVRELRNAVQRLLVTPDRPLYDASIQRDSSIQRVAPSTAPDPEDAGPLPLRLARREASDNFERAYLALVLARTGGNVTRAAAVAEVSRQMMQKLLRKHGPPGTD